MSNKAATLFLAGAVIAVTHRFFWLDPALAAVIAVVIAVAAVKLLADGIRELRANHEANRRTDPT